MTGFRPIDRRTMLRGMGTAMALPWLEAMAPIRGLGQAMAAVNPATPPVRMAFLFIPNGVHAPEWKPSGVGLDCTLPAMLAPLERH